MTDGRTLRAQAQRVERRASMLEAAMRVFAERGYHDASIADIVSAAGVARGTFYLYFQSKNEVFLALLDELSGRFRAAIVGVDTRPDAPPLHDQLVERVHLLLLAVEGSREVARILFREANVLDADVTARVRAFEDRMYGYIRTSLANGVRLGMLRPHDADVAATVVYGSLRQLIDRRLLADPSTPDLRALAAEVVRFALDGLRAT
ncbi:MAG TPA: TetR/AcrR family transcriptional regulator [Myxococcota bacterium]|nr:TetR/AcrR family transcriptional regulator [Myxococcota bacterium]